VRTGLLARPQQVDDETNEKEKSRDTDGDQDAHPPRRTDAQANELTGNQREENDHPCRNAPCRSRPVKPDNPVCINKRALLKHV
jgi:hypothetical protein